MGRILKKRKVEGSGVVLLVWFFVVGSNKKEGEVWGVNM